MGGLHSRDATIAPQLRPGDKIPSVNMDEKFPPSADNQVNISQLTMGRKVVIMGLPGAFTPC